MVIHALGEDHKSGRSLVTENYLHGDDGPMDFLKQNIAYIVIFGSVLLLGMVMTGTLERRAD